MIVDDEASIRKGLRQFIDWSSWNIKVVAEASKGSDALDLALQTFPDILITDIRMPDMDGITLSRQIKERLPSTRIVILSGYSDMEYYKSALAIGVRVFLQKPAGSSEIIKTVLNLKAEIVKERDKQQLDYVRDALLEENRPILNMHFINDIIANRISSGEVIRNKAQLLGIPFDGPYYRVLVMKISTLNLEYNQSQYDNDIDQWRIIQSIEKLMESHNGVFICEVETSKYMILINGKDNGSIGEMTSAACDALYLEMEQKMGKKTVIAVGNIVDDVTQVRQSYRNAEKVLRHHAWRDDTHLFYAEEIQPCDEKTYISEAMVLENKAIINLSENALERALLDLAGMFEKYRAVYADFNLVREACRRMLNFISNHTPSIGDAVDNRDDMYSFMDKLEMIHSVPELESWMSLQIKKRLQPDTTVSKRHSTLIHKTLAYINEHYKEDLTLQSVAKEVFISPSYLGRIFREAMGVPMHEWINKHRIECAKELLRNPELKSSEIAPEVGFSSYKYFSGYFLKYVGCSPREYRNQL